jgi:hypothetical protein
MSVRCAIVNMAAGVVENIIVADPETDSVRDGYSLVGNPPYFVEIGTVWDGANFVAPKKPNPVPGMTLPAPIDGLDML